MQPQNTLTIQMGFTPEAQALLANFITTAEGLGMKGVTGGRKPKTAQAQDAETEETDAIDVSSMKAEAESEDLGLEETPKPKAKAAATIDDVRRALKGFLESNGREKTAKLLSKFGVKSVTDLKTTQYADVIKATN